MLVTQALHVHVMVPGKGGGGGVGSVTQDSASSCLYSPTPVIRTPLGREVL